MAASYPGGNVLVGLYALEHRAEGACLLCLFSVTNESIEATKKRHEATRSDTIKLSKSSQSTRKACRHVSKSSTNHAAEIRYPYKLPGPRGSYRHLSPPASVLSMTRLNHVSNIPIGSRIMKIIKTDEDIYQCNKQATHLVQVATVP